ncbi:MAG: hypothetical protein ACUVWA_13825 [Candidatus Oleimicrobiaceae bacterium]
MGQGDGPPLGGKQHGGFVAHKDGEGNYSRTGTDGDALAWLGLLADHWRRDARKQLADNCRHSATWAADKQGAGSNGTQGVEGVLFAENFALGEDGNAALFDVDAQAGSLGQLLQAGGKPLSVGSCMAWTSPAWQATMASRTTLLPGSPVRLRERSTSPGPDSAVTCAPRPLAMIDPPRWVSRWSG